MQQRILLALAVIVAVGGGVAASTGAFFSDTETSTGNTFAAGAIDLKVDSQSHYDGLTCTDGIWHEDVQGQSQRPDLIGQACDGTWALKDLNPTLDKFFNFTDVKPGDGGENTVSLHIDNNPAWACVTINNIHNDDNDCTSPESQAGSGDPECIASPNALLGANSLGELAQNMDFVIWSDNGATEGHKGNNVLDADETVLSHGHGPVANTTYTLADSTTGTPITAGSDSYLGAAWCIGTFTTVTPGQPLVCDGTLVGNNAQTDSYTGDISFHVEQARNQPHFRCTPQ